MSEYIAVVHGHTNTILVLCVADELWKGRTETKANFVRYHLLLSNSQANNRQKLFKWANFLVVTGHVFYGHE